MHREYSLIINLSAAATILLLGGLVEVAGAGSSGFWFVVVVLANFSFYVLRERHESFVHVVVGLSGRLDEFDSETVGEFLAFIEGDLALAFEVALVADQEPDNIFGGVLFDL